MKEKNKIIIAGLIITGLGALLTPTFESKFLILTNTLAFVGFLYAGMITIAQNKGISLEDIDKSIESKIAESKKEENYLKLAGYLSVRPIVMVGIIAIGLYLLSFLFFV